MNVLCLVFIFIGLLIFTSLTIPIDNESFTATCFIIVSIIGITFAFWAGISAMTPNEIQETQLLAIENKTINKKTIQISYYQKNDSIESYNITNKYGFSLDKDKYLLKRDIFKKGPYIGLYWTPIEKFTIVEKEKDE